MKITIDPKEATRICNEALFKHVAEQGLKNAKCEPWFVNCKRKGIIFTGIKNDDNKLTETEDDGRKRDGTGKYVPAGAKG